MGQKFSSKHALTPHQIHYQQKSGSPHFYLKKWGEKSQIKWYGEKYEKL